MSLTRESETVKAFEGGSFRDRPAGKGLFSPMPMNALLRIAKRYEYGALKYGKSEAYKDGLPVSDCFNSAMRHLIQYMSGDNSEDHLAAACWNCMAMMYMEEENPQWQDVKSRKKLSKKRGSFNYIERALEEGIK